MNKTRIAYFLSLTGYLGLFSLIMVSLFQLPPDNHPPRLLLLFILAGPLLFPLRGLLHGRPYTHAWSGFMALVYLVIAIAIAADEKTLFTGIGEALLSGLWFTGSLLFVRWSASKEKSA
ncbi:MAG TPA: DUF2069 domain-containing protein [Gammaproteobacteria bacterium]|nr:DUF2069 domain-containing protein [Gammaproteobacteria bacterium]